MIGTVDERSALPSDDAMIAMRKRIRDLEAEVARLTDYLGPRNRALLDELMKEVEK